VRRILAALPKGRCLPRCGGQKATRGDREGDLAGEGPESSDSVSRERILVRIARLHIQRFRGFEDFVLLPRAHVAVVGEPRAGRSDLIAALRRVLEPRSVLARPSEWDVYRPLPDTGSDPDGVTALLTTVEVSLLELPDETEQALQDRLELLDSTSGEVVDDTTSDEAELGVRLRYCLDFDRAEERLEHWVEYPKTGNRVSRAERELLAAFVLDRNPPLQLRAEGVLRRLASVPDPAALAIRLQTFAGDIATATDELAEGPEVQAALQQVTRHGARRLLELDPGTATEAIGFAAEDGSLAALLRSVQPTLELDAAGVLPLSAHGSTTTAILAAAEASASAGSNDAVVLADDFGDQLDAASGEYLAARLRRAAGQLWLTTRQPEVPRAFAATELVRLTRSSGVRDSFQLSTQPNRKERLRRRHLFALLGPALAARTVVLLEGPHDLETYTAVSNRLLRQQPAKAPLAAYGMRLVPASASGGEGGKQELPKLATLAGELGLAVRIVLDHDKPGSDAALLTELSALAEMVIHLPERVAVERAIVDGLTADALRPALTAVNADHGLSLVMDDLGDADLPAQSVWALKQKGGLHAPFIEALPAGVVPPVAAAVLQQLKQPAGDDPLIALAAP
jgi:putative ATP-dependent endonuclease of OLD family